MDLGNLNPALILVTVVGLALAPFVAVMVTSFTKIVVVLSLLRNGLGLQQVPPNVVINGLAIILSIYIMYPVILDSYGAIDQRAAAEPAQKFDVRQLFDLASSGREPLRSIKEQIGRRLAARDHRGAEQVFAETREEAGDLQF